MYYWTEIKRKVYGLWERRVESTVQWRNKIQVRVCISKRAVALLFHLVIVCVIVSVCAEEGSKEKINKEYLPLILRVAHCPCLPLNVGIVRKYERKRLSNTYSPPSTQCVYTKGKCIKE